MAIKLKNIFIVILLIVSSVASFLLGGNLSIKSIAKSVDRMQAKLSFHHLQTYRDIQSDLMSDCKSRAESRLKQIIDEQKMLMAEYVQQHAGDKKFENYINLRDDNLIKELSSYKLNRYKRWTLSDCRK